MKEGRPLGALCMSSFNENDHEFFLNQLAHKNLH
jgi:hypothetical protein